MSEDRGPNGQPLMFENPDDGRAPGKCAHCGKVAEDGYDIELVEGERGGPAKEAFLCDDCMEAREDGWGNDELVNGMEGICDMLGISNYLEPSARVERAEAAIQRGMEAEKALAEYLKVADKAGYLSQANLSENPYSFIPGGPESHYKGRSCDSPLYVATRNLVKVMQPDPEKWERDQLVARAKYTEKCLNDLYYDRRMYESGQLGYLRNLWAIPDLEALLKKTQEEIGAIILKRRDLAQ